MTNLALRDARLRACLSQTELALRIQEAGWRSGEPNGCTRVMVQRWESGKTRRPQPRYLLAMEHVLGKPAASLGFADAELGIDRGRAVARAGLDGTLPALDPRATYGPLSGIWLSTYGYRSSSRNLDLTNSHYVRMDQRGAVLRAYSLPVFTSRLSLDMSADGSVATGTWTELTDPAGYYAGALYHGAIQLLQDPTGRQLAGKWVGFGKELEVNSGPWTLRLVDAEFSDEAVRRWNREPEETRP